MKRAIIIVSKKVESSMKVTTVIINMIENMERRVDTNRGKNGSPVVVIKFLNDEVCFFKYVSHIIIYMLNQLQPYKYVST